jgi:hypothetical protein
MNREDIKSMASKSDIAMYAIGLKYDGLDATQGFLNRLEAFAKLVAQHEREECIKACEQVTADLKKYAPAFEGITAEIKFVRNIGGILGEPFVDAIRARGQV